MNTYLGVIPGVLGFHELPLETYEARRNFVDGNMEYLSLDSGIDIWFNDFIKDEPEIHGVAVVIDFDGRSLPIYGNVYFASCDDEGSTIPLSKEQVGWIKEHAINALIKGTEHSVIQIKY